MTARLLLALTLAAWCAARRAQAEDYDARSTEWNGLAALAALAREPPRRCPLEERRVLDWEALSGHDVLLVLYPLEPLDEAATVAFVSSGGRLVLADDFGRGQGALRALGIERRAVDAGAGLRRHQDNPALPIAVAVRQTPLAQGSRELISNHPALLNGRAAGLPATYAFPGPAQEDLGLVVEGLLGRGRFVALGDPSLFINNMLELPADRRFAERLVAELCRPGVDRLLLLHGRFPQHGAPPAVLVGAPSHRGSEAADVADQWNRALSGANLHIQEVLAGTRTRLGLDAAALCGLVLALGALMLALRYLPLAAAPHDQGFAQAPRPPETGLWALVTRYSRRDVPWGFLYPAALLREEAVHRLRPLLGEVSLEQLTPAQVAAAVGAKAGARAGRAAAELWRDLQRLPALPSGRAWVAERRLQRLYQRALTLFALLPPFRKAAP